MVGNVAGCGNVVELRGRESLGSPRFAAIHRHIRAAIVALDHALGIGGVDPKVVIVAVWNANRLKCLAAVNGFVETGIEHVDRIARFGVGVDAGIVEGALAETAILTDSFPGGAGVVGGEDSPVIGFDDGVDVVGIAA
jgi:hypothetical protein